MNSNIHFFRALCLVVGFSLAPGTSFAENWMLAPQICVGKAHSNEARAADWQIGLRSTRGTIAVRSFSLTGNLERRNQTTGHVRALGKADSSSQAEAIAATDDDEASDVVSAYKGPCDVAASPDGKRLYVVENDAHALAVVSVAEGKVVQTIPLPDEPTGVCVSPDGKSAYVTCGVANGLLCVIDLSSGRVTAKLPVGHSPRGPSLSPNGERAYVCNRFDNSVSVVDLVAKQELARVRVLREPFDSAITPDGKTLFVTNHLPIDEAELLRRCLRSDVHRYVDVPSRADSHAQRRHEPIRRVCLAGWQIRLRCVCVGPIPDAQDAGRTRLGRHECPVDHRREEEGLRQHRAAGRRRSRGRESVRRGDIARRFDALRLSCGHARSERDQRDGHA